MTIYNEVLENFCNCKDPAGTRRFDAAFSMFGHEILINDYIEYCIY